MIDEARAVRLEPLRLNPAPPAGALILIGVVRNEAPILTEFLAHYRRLGVDRFVMLDNLSDDGTAELLAGAPDVDLYRVDRPFLPPMKQGWINRAIATYGRGRWYVTADADEHLVFDGSGPRTLRDLVAFAERRGLSRVRGMLVDMYGPGPVLALPSAPLAAAFPLFDGDGYTESLCKQRISRHGGPRRRRFSSGGTLLAPELTKYPLFRIEDGEIFDNPHHLYPYRANFASPCLVAILHYKFNRGLARKIEDAVGRRQYFGDSVEYRQYQRVLAENPGLRLGYPGTRRYREPADLVARALIEPIPWTARRTSLASLLGRARNGWIPAPTGQLRVD